MVDMDYARFKMGKYADDIYSLTRRIQKFNRRTNKEDKTKMFNELLSYYDFDSADYLTGDIMLDKHQIIRDADINKDSVIALALKGIMIVQKKKGMDN